MLSTIIVYHTKSSNIPCFDGFAAATVMWRTYGDTAEYVTGLYHQVLPLENFADRDVVFVDFSYDVETMDSIFGVAKSLCVLDHHAPKSKDFEGREYAHFCETSCGATLAWRHLHGEASLPLMIELIDDGDRVLNIHPDVDKFHASLGLEELSFSRWSELMDSLSYGSEAYNKFIQKGAQLVTYDAKRIASLVKEAFAVTFCGISGLAVNTNKFYAHNVGMALAKYSRTFGAAFYVRADGNVEVSLRRIDPDINVFDIASTFGGGGHPGAAAFSVSLEKFGELTQHPPQRNDLLVRIDSATKTFQQDVNIISEEDISHIEDAFLEHMRRDLGTAIADSLEFSITKSVSHPNLWARLLSGLALAVGMPRQVPCPKWYHHLFPYVERKEITFDEDSIRNVLLESKPAGKSVNSFFVERLMDTVCISYPKELITSTYYLHAVVSMPDSPLTIRHTFEVSK